MAEPQLAQALPTPPMSPDEYGRSDTVPLTNPLPTQETVSLPAPGPRPVTPSPDEALPRAFRANFGLGKDMGLSYEDMYQHIISGDESNLRAQAAATVNAQNAEYKQKVIGDIIRKRGGNVSPTDYAILDYELGKVTKPVGPGTVFEEKFYKAYMNKLATTAFSQPSSRMYEAMQQEPEAVDAMSGYATTALAKNRIALNKVEEVNARAKQQGWGSYLLDLGIDFATSGLYSEYNLRGLAGTKMLESLGLGSSMQAAVDKLNALPTLAEYETAVTKVLGALEAKAPFLAVQFGQYLAGQTIAEQGLDNFFTALNVSGLKPIISAKGASFVLRKLGIINGAKEDVAAMMRNAASGGADTTVGIIRASGDVKEAGIQSFVVGATKELSGQLNAPVKELAESLPSVINVIDNNRGAHTRETVNRLKEVTQRDTLNLATTVEKMVKMEVDPILATDTVARRAWDQAKTEFKEYSILDVGQNIKHSDPTKNLFTFNVDIGKPGAELFFSPQVAENYAKANGFKGYKVVPPDNTANGFVIRFERTQQPNPYLMAQPPIPTTAEGPKSWLDFIPGARKYLTSEETLSAANRENRKVAVYGQSELYRLAATIGEDLKSLTRGAGIPFTPQKQRWDDFKRVLNAAAKDVDPKDGLRGRFFEHPDELDAFYRQILNRAPDEKETLAYFSHKRLLEMKRFLDNRQAYINKLRAGTETHTIDTMDTLGQKYTLKFDGTRAKELPRGDDAILFLSRDAKEHDLDYRNHLNPATLGRYERGLANGELQAVRVYNSMDRPFEHLPFVGNVRVGTVITETGFKSEAIGINQIPTRLRPELEYNYAYSIKQARIRQESIRTITRSIYEGDTHIMPMAIREMGKDVAKTLDNVRQLIAANKLDEAKALTNSKLPVEWEELHSWFKYDVTSEGLPIPPRLSLTEPIQLVRNNQKIVHKDILLEGRYETPRDVATGQTREFKDGTRMDLAAQHNYNPNRPDDYGLFTLKNEGSKANPTYKVAPAEFVDVIPSMNRAMGRMVRTAYMADYKRTSVQEWLAQAKDHLIDGDRSANSPNWYFEHGKFKPQADVDLKNRLEVQRFQIKQLLSVPDELENSLHAAAEKMNDWVYGKLGQKAAETLAPTWLLPRLSDPTAFIRAITFHSTLGLFSLPQLMVQMNTFTTIAGISGYKAAAPGTKAAFFHMLMGVNADPKLLAKYDSMATRQLLPGTHRWLPGQFTEAFEAGKSTGFFNVGKEYSMDVWNPKVLTSTAGDFLDAGTYFFRTGEKSVRAGAWYTAYQEFRAANPTARLTNDITKQILNRADLLSVNMSRASNSLLHTGIMSVPAQFLSYQLRLSELVMGKRLTQLERSRLVGTYAALYGVPTSLGLTGIPFADFMRKSAEENGYVVGNNYLETLATDGALSLLSGLVTGATTGKATYLNFPERYGSSGFEPIREALRSDQSWLKLAGGAAFGKFGSAFANYDPFIATLQSMWKGDGQFKLHAADWLRLTKEISSVNAGVRAYIAFNTSNWTSKDESLLDKNISPALAAFMTVSGTSPQQVQDSYLKIWSTKDMEASHQKGIKLYIKERRRGYEIAQTDKAQSIEFNKNAVGYLKMYGVPMKDWDKAEALAQEGRKTLVDKIDWSFYITKAPQEQAQSRRDSWRTIQKIKDGK